MDEAKFLKKHIKTGTIDVHPTENAIVVNYRIEATVIGEEGESIFSNKQDCQKVIRISALDNETDLKSLASEVIRRCHLIPEGKTLEIEQLLYYLQNKKSNKTLNNLTKSVITGDQSSRSNSSSNSLNSSTEKADLNNLNEYIDMLYDDMYTKNRGTVFILDLVRRANYLDELSQNDVLLGVLARVLREEWKKSIEFTTNVINIFSCFSDYTQFHQMISRHKIGALCMQIAEYELKRYELFLRPSSSSSPNVQQSSPAGRNSEEDFVVQRANTEESPKMTKDAKVAILIRKQFHLFSAIFRLLFNLSQEKETELKMVNRGVVDILCQTWQQTLEKRSKLKDDSSDRTKSAPHLLILIGNFLKKLSVYVENMTKMAELKIIDKIIKAIINWPRNENLIESMLRLLFNLSFNSKLRRKMSTANFVTQIVPYIGNENLQIYTLPLLYHISMDVQCKSMFSYTDCISMCLKLCLSFDETSLFWTKSDSIMNKNRDDEIFDGQNSALAASSFLKLPPFARRTTSPISSSSNPTNSNNNLEIAGNFCTKEKNERRSYIYKICSSLLINLSTNKRNAELIAGEDFSTLKTLIEKAFDYKSRLLAHLLRNISTHDGPLKFFFVEYVGDFANAVRKIRLNILDKNPSDNETRRRFAFGVECLLVLSNLNIPELNFGALIEEFNLLEWISEALSNAAYQHESLIFAVLAFLGAVMGDANGAALLLERGVILQLTTILSEKQENDELVQHVLYVFYRAMFHENTRRFLIEDSKIPVFLMELMHDSHSAVRKLCDNSLDLIAEHSVEWAVKIREERFKWHNAQWLEIVAGSSSSNYANYSNQNLSDDQQSMDDRSSSDDDASDDLDHFITDEQLFADDGNNDQRFDSRPDEPNLQKSIYAY